MSEFQSFPVRLIVLLLLGLGIGATTSFAQQFRIATWQVEQLPSGKADATDAAAAEKRFAEVAEVLTGTDADVIILHGVPDIEAARKIASLLKGRKYSAIHHTSFRHGQRGPVVNLPFAILSRRDRVASKNVEWTHTGRIDNMPGGFGFAAYRLGPTAVCLYVASLPGSLTNGVGPSDGRYYGRKRNYAAQYLVHHANWLATTITNSAIAAYVTGDFLPVAKGPVSDECVKILEGAGFRFLAPGVVSDRTTLSITNNSTLDRVQDPIFTKGLEFMASRQINRPAPEHPIVVCDMTFKAANAATRTATKPTAARPPATKPVAELESPARLAPVVAAEAPIRPTTAVAPRPASAKTFSATNSLSDTAASTPVSTSAPALPAVQREPWLPWLLGAVGLAVVSLAGWTWALRHQKSVSSTAARRVASLHLEFQPAALGPPPDNGNAATLHPLSTATGQTDHVPWETPVVRGESEARVRITPDLKRLMRDAAIAWLARQRTQLLESHERGTDQVLELHARVETIKEQFQERLRSQQQRIADLDAALRNKEKVILELIRGQRSSSGS